MLKKFLIAFTVLLFGAGMGIAGWWFGFRDGISMAYSESGLRLNAYYEKHLSNDPVATKSFLDFYTADVALHLLNVRHSFPLYHTLPYMSQSVLKHLRANWHPDEKAFRTTAMLVTVFPTETPRADYWAAWQQVEAESERPWHEPPLHQSSAKATNPTSGTPAPEQR